MKKHIILFFAASQLGPERIALDREARAVQVELECSGYRDCFELVTCWVAEPLDLLRQLRKRKPTVVHFSGHGGRGVAGRGRSLPVTEPRYCHEFRTSRGRAERYGLLLQGRDDQAQFVLTAALEETFAAAGASVKLVVLNACYSEAQAEALLAHVDCVVGMGSSIHDDAARTFAMGFYGGLGECESVAVAYKQGRAAMSLEGLGEGGRPQLKVRNGIDANQIVLAAEHL